MVLDGGNHARPAASEPVAAGNRNHGRDDVPDLSCVSRPGDSENAEMKWLYDISDFLRRVRREMRFGERSRAPLKLVRLAVTEDVAECEWIARPADVWDKDLPAKVRGENEIHQALVDALGIREALFNLVPQIRYARVKVYRYPGTSAAQVIITGDLSREDEPPPRLSSLVMRAKLCGLRFNLSDLV
jgi:hypothetical protein